MRDVWKPTRRWWRVLQARLRQRRAVVALLLLCTFGLGESLICILHCEVWLPMALRSFTAGQHQHHHHHGMVHAAADATTQVDAPTVPGSSVGAPPTTCFWRYSSGSPSDAPLPLPPSPVHEMTMVAGVLLALVLLIFRYLIDPPGDPPHISRPPPLRPPIPFAG